ncbi:atrial natriuretic peptide receptor 3 [Anopheles ziemanni]|uniref:atrial natriuretic peptide receptor 3 n=1 Tax=Anopheles coustani TaxID=139045 RepID=UPI002657B88F|nr:atrial natriuretic peptide receptor 3 [Anopheles coustani]XP_058169105.1 atrial natriuretic peptide receptor 3 [Anopheles ziemanni]
MCARPGFLPGGRVPDGLVRLLLLAALLLGLEFVVPPSLVEAGCRRLEQKPCEAICVRTTSAVDRSSVAGANATGVAEGAAGTSGWMCELRVVVIMPANTSVEASLPRVQPVLDKAEEFIRREGIIPPAIKIKWISFDDRCEQARATVMAMDGTGSSSCGHVILGPSCDFALAPVARIARYIYNDGIPVITGAGYTFDFEEPKTHCENEFHMLFRTGLVSFKRMAFFMIDLIRHFKWNRVVYFYERQSYYNVAGPQTGHLLMNTMAEFFRHENITYSPFSTDSARTNLTESLKEKVGLNYASEYWKPLARRYRSVLFERSTATNGMKWDFGEERDDCLLLHLPKPSQSA